MRPLIQAVTSDYDRVKSVMSKARHPTFIGREQVQRIADNGGAIVWVMDGVDVAVSLVDTRRSVLLALSVVRQGEGIGGRVLEYIRPNWARVVESKVPWFERHGYERVGRITQGKTLRTQVMVRRGLRSLGERVALLEGRHGQE